MKIEFQTDTSTWFLPTIAYIHQGIDSGIAVLFLCWTLTFQKS